MNREGTTGGGMANVRIGRSISLTTAVAVGSIITVGIVVYLFLGPVFTITGTETPSAYALTLFFFLPIVLAVAERSSVTPGQGGIFNLSRSSGSVPVAFATGWLIFGGFLSLVALFAYEGAVAVGELLKIFVEIEPDLRLLAVALIILILPFNRMRPMGFWKSRTTFIYATLFLLLFILFSAWFAPLQIPATWVYLPTAKSLFVIPLMAAGLWGIQFVLDRRDALRRPRRQVLTALYLPIAVGGIVGAIAAATLIIYPSITYLKPLPLYTLAQQMHPLLALSVLTAMLFIGLIGINESFVGVLKLSDAMTGDGFLPDKIQFGRRYLQRRLYIGLAVIIIPALLALFSTIEMVVAIVSSTIFLALIIVNSQDLFHLKSNLAPNRWPKLPFHPLVPAIAVTLCIAAVITQGLESFIWLLPWIAAGALIYIVFAREAAIAVRRRDAMMAGAIMPVKKTNYRVMVALSDPSRAASLFRLANSLTAARRGQLVILRVALQTGSEKIDQQRATDEWQALYTLVSEQDNLQVPTTPMVRLAPDAAGGILTTVWEEKIDLIILGWPDADNEGFHQHDGSINQIVRKTQSEVAIVKGAWPEEVSSVLVPVISKAHSEAALSLGRDILSDHADEQKVVALQLVHGKLTDERRHLAEDQQQENLKKLDDSQFVQGKVTGAVNIKEGALQAAEGFDVLLLGLSNEGFLAETDFSGLPLEIALAAELPTVLIKRSEKAVSYWMRRSWDHLSDLLPKLSPKRRAVVGTDMRHHARADIDFYVLMVLAASIALFGLLQDSAAVIIGAMLVAPLMSPILAMAHSIVRGQPKILRQAAESTLNGVVLAIAVGALLSLLLASFGIPIPPTTEILARTEPNFLDLLVALASGAAAAYAISRSEVGAALPGVAIAAALVPPLAVVGYGLGTVQFDLAAGSSLLFLTNLAAIILAAAVVFLLLGFRPPIRDDSDKQARSGLRMAIIALVLIAIPLFATSRASASLAARNEKVAVVMDQYWPPTQAEVTELEVMDTADGNIKVSCMILDYEDVVSDQSLAELQVLLGKALDESVILDSQTIDARLRHYDDTGAARQLTLTPTSTEIGTLEATPSAPPTSTLQPIFTPAPIINPAVDQFAPPTRPPAIISTQIPDMAETPFP